MSKGFQIVGQRKGRAMGRSASMRAPYGLQIIESCITCPYKQDRLFCNLPPEALKRLSEITASATYPKGAKLFVEGQSARGVFVLCTGQLKLSTSATDGKTLILKIAEPGDVLGLPATISGKAYEVTAEVLEPTQANFIGRADFLGFLREYGEAALRVAQELSQTYHSAFDEMRTIGLSHSAGEKLARFVLDWAAHQEPQGEPKRYTLSLTHEEIAQMIGATRETVTRLLADFKKKQLLHVKGSTLLIKDKSGLERIVAGH
jgi:CRP/FNR family transcriptional regulator